MIVNENDKLFKHTYENNLDLVAIVTKKYQMSSLFVFGTSKIKSCP
jgi:hypothetical protein